MKKKNYTRASMLKRWVILTCILAGMRSKSMAQVDILIGANPTPVATYNNLKEAFDAINAGTHQGAITINITGTGTYTDPGAPAVLNSSGATPANYTSILIQPTADAVIIKATTTTGRGVIELKGADNVTINGDNPGTSGTNRNLTIQNLAANTVNYTSCVRIATAATVVTSADGNTIKNCVLAGSATLQNGAGTSASGPGNTTFGIYCGGNGGTTATDAPIALNSVTANTAPSGTTINTLLIDNNAVNSCARAVVFNGANATVSTGVTVSNNLIGDFTVSISGIAPYSSPATTVYTKGVFVAGTNAISITGNTFNNIMSNIATTISAIELNTAIGTGTISLTGNTINNLTNNQGGGSATKAILVSNSSGAYTIGGNIITNTTCFSNSPGADAIDVTTTAPSGIIENNKITGVYNRLASAVVSVYGINQAGGSNVTVRNNFISDVKMDMSVNFTSNFGTSLGVHALRLSSGNGHKVYHNSVNLTGSLFGVSGGQNHLVSAFTITLTSNINTDVRNNLFSNSMSGGSAGSAYVCIYLPSGATSAMNLTLNSNAYYCGSGTSQGIAQVGTASGTGFYTAANFNSAATTPSTNLRAYTSTLSAAGTNDNTSLVSTAAAPFTTASDLHIPAATPSPLESGGVTTTVTTDIDGNVRPGPAGSVNGGGTFPDIGADEFDGVPADLAAPNISYTVLGPTCSATDRTLTATITDASGVPTTGSLQPRIYYRKNAGSYSSSQGVLSSGTATNGTWTFTIVVADMGGVGIGDQVFYYVIAQDIAGTPNISSNPSGVTATNVNTVSSPPPVPNNYFVQGALGGTFNVGVSQTYTTLTAAVNAYNGSCLTGPVTFILTDASYPSETFPITITSNAYTSAVNTLTIQPNIGVAVSISGTSTSAIIKINGGDYITIDGLNTGGSSLTLTNNDAGATGTVTWVGSASATDAATNNAIKNCMLIGNASTTTFAGVFVGSGTTVGAGGTAEAPNNQLTIQGCSFTKMKYGIYANGNATTSDANWTFTQNTIGSTLATDKLSASAIILFNAQNFSVNNNTISGVASASTTTASGIGVFSNSVNGSIYNNKISDIKNSNNGAAQGSNGIQLSTTSTTANISVYNNFIWDVASFGSASTSATSNGWGMLFTGGGGYNIYFNTIYLSTDQTFATGITAAINITNGIATSNAINLRNNILANTQTVGSQHYTIICAGAFGAATFTDINYNDYYFTGPNLGRISGTDQVNLAAWQSASTKDANSLSVNPSFVSTTNLHLITSSSPLDNSGVSIAGITTDIDGDSRPATPDMGADEFTFANNNCTGTPTPGSIQNSFTLCPLQTTTLNVTGYTQGVLGITFQWEESDDNGGTDPWANAVGGSGSNTIAYTTPGSLNNIYYRCKVTCSFSALFDYTNVCTITVTPFTVPEDFSSVTFPPTCWTRNDATYIFRASSSAYGSGSGSAEFNFYSATYQANLDLTTPAFTPYPNGYLLYFDHAYATYSGEIDSLVILYSTNGGSSYNTLIVYQGGTSGPLNTGGTVGSLTQFVPTAAQWASKLVALPNGTNRIIFRGKGNFGNNLYIDNINFLPPQACDAPVTPTVSNVTAISADISWSCVGCTGTFQLDYGANGHTAGTGTLISNVISPYTLNPPLNPNTAYTVYVRQNCGVYGFGNWSSGVNFTTLCNLPAPSIFQDYSGAGLCDGTSLTLDGDNIAVPTQTGNTWSWTKAPSSTVLSTSQNYSLGSVTTANSGDYYLTVTNGNGCTATISQTVTVNPNPVVGVASIPAQPSVSCFGLSDGSVQLTGSGGSGSGYFYELNAVPSGSGLYTGLMAGTYPAIVTDGNNCESAQIMVPIGEPALLTVSAGSNTPVCTGTTLNLNSTPTGGTTAYSYSWTGPNGPVAGVQNPTKPSAVLADGGQYNLMVTDAHGCTATASHTVVVNPSPSAVLSLVGTQISSSFRCLNQATPVQLAFTGTGPWNYTISGSGGPYTNTTSSNPLTINVTPTAAGTQSYTITALGNPTCPTSGTTSGSVVLSVATSAPANNSVSGVSAPGFACSGTVALVTASSTATGVYYSWNQGSGSNSVKYSNVIGGPFTNPNPYQTTANQAYAQFGAICCGQSGYFACVQAANGCGSTSNKCSPWVQAQVSGPASISPATQVVACPNDVKTYTCASSSGATVYNWTLGGSATPITSGQGTPNVTVTFPSAFVSGNLCVTAALSCGGSSTSAPRCMTITKVPVTPNPISGAAIICPGATNVSYSIPAMAGVTGYNWTVPSGVTITGGQNTPAITASFPANYSGAPSICVTATTPCANSAGRCMSVASGVPAQPAGITGQLFNLCNSSVQFSIIGPVAGLTYTWTAPSGTSISLGQGSSTILLAVSSTFNTGTLSVVANSSSCPGSSPARVSSGFWGRPNTPGTITASPAVFCSGFVVNFSVANQVGPVPNYLWTTTNGAVSAGQGTNSADITWGTNAAGTVKVRASNSCGINPADKSQVFTPNNCREEGNGLAGAEFSVYPNPAHDRITVSMEVQQDADYVMELMDFSGRVVLSENKSALSGLNTYELDLSHLAKGIYMLEVRSTADHWKTKVVVE